MIRQYGTAKIPEAIRLEKEAELERAKTERLKHQAVVQELSEKQERNRAKHRAWLKALELEESPNSLDADNLLRCALRLLRELVKQRRVTLSLDEYAVLNIIEQRELVRRVLALIVQAALTVGQTNIRADGFSFSSWPYIALVLADVALNGIGLLIATATVQTTGDALLYVLRAFKTGAGAWQVVAALGVAALIAALPEQLVRDAM